MSRSCISPSCVSDFISEHDGRFYPIAKHNLHHCRGFQILPNGNHSLCGLSRVKIIDLSLCVSDRQGEFPRTAEFLEHGPDELRVREVCERNGRVVGL